MLLTNCFQSRLLQIFFYVGKGLSDCVNTCMFVRNKKRYYHLRAGMSKMDTVIYEIEKSHFVSKSHLVEMLQNAMHVGKVLKLVIVFKPFPSY